MKNTNAHQFEQLTAVEGPKSEALKKLFDYCVQQENLVKSRLVARTGGCDFDGCEVPSTFNFSS